LQRAARKRDNTPLGWALLLVQLPAVAVVGYLDLLSVAAILWRSAPAAVEPRHRFAILIPAHDEEILLPRLLHSLDGLDYPRHLYTVHVVADNCTDRTAERARAAGAQTYVRTDPDHVGKGHALQWLLGQVRERGGPCDAYVLLDADTLVAPALLRVFGAHLARGDRAIQAYYGVLNADASWQATLRHIALLLYNGLRPRGRDALGLSAGLRGNGMCFEATLLERGGWDASGLAEDAEFHLRLVGDGVRVRYAAQTSVLAEMPVSLRQAQSQNLRWERGRLQLLRSYGPGLLRMVIALRDPAPLDALAEQATPPLSVLTLLTTLTLAITAALRQRRARRMAVAVLLGQMGYVGTGLALARARPAVYLALLRAPLYAGWKLGLYLVALLGRRDRRWVRTQRMAE